MRRYDQRPCTSNSRSRYANRARAKSLARTACLPSWPLIPTPMWAAGHRHRHTMNTNGSTLGTLCPWTNYGDLSWLLDIRLTAFFTSDKIDKLAPEKYKPFWILRKEEMMGDTSSYNFYRPDALVDARPTVSKHWRQSWTQTRLINTHKPQSRFDL